MKAAVPPPAHQALAENDVQAIDELRAVFARLKAELAKVIVGQNAVIERLAICLFARGHALLMGVPALLNEGLSWRDVRLRTMHAAPVTLGPLPAERAGGLSRVES